MPDPQPPVHPPQDAKSVDERARGAQLLLEILRDKWRLPVLLALLQAPHGKQRYTELLRRTPDVSHTMLSRALRDLENGGLVTREVFATVPARVEYTLTALGRQFAEPILLMEKWSRQHEAELLEVRAKMKRTPRRKPSPRKPAQSPSSKAS